MYVTIRGTLYSHEAVGGGVDAAVVPIPVWGRGVRVARSSAPGRARGFRRRRSRAISCDAAIFGLGSKDL